MHIQQDIHVHIQSYPMLYPLFIQCILQAYPYWLSTPIQQDIHVHIQFIQWDIHYLSNSFSKQIQLVILAYPTGYSNIPFIQLNIQWDIWSDLLPGHPGGWMTRNCHPDLHSSTRSCIICCFRWAATVL
jgi:hypothetical protein